MSKIAFDRLSFLVVDDNSHMRRLVRSLLHGFGSRQVYEAEDGAGGLEAVETYGPDIMITDWAMPIFDGLELIQMIRNPDSCKNAYIPIIMLTGHSEKHRVMQARDVGVTEFLCKPISAKALYDRIYNIVMNPRPFIRTKNYFGPDRRRYANPSYSGPERRKNPAEIVMPPQQIGIPQIGPQSGDQSQEHWEVGQTDDEIDALFEKTSGPDSDEDIDAMFDKPSDGASEDVSNDDIDAMFDKASDGASEDVSNDDIDAMFDNASDDASADISNDDIDKLFEDTPA